MIAFRNIKTKLIIVPVCLFLCLISCVFAYAREEDKVLILMYGGIDKRPSSRNVSVESFRKQISLLKENGYNTITLENLSDFYYSDKTLPEKSVLITFDASKKDSYRYVDPILKEAGFNAVMFLLPEKIDTGDHFFICWHDVKNMLKSNRWEFGVASTNAYKYINVDSKGKKAPYLFNRLWFRFNNRLETEEEFAKRITKEYTDLIGHAQKRVKNLKIFSASIPYGNYFYWTNESPGESDPCLILNKRLAQENFKLVFLQETGGIVTKKSNPHALGRMVVDGNWSDLDFASHIGLRTPLADKFIDTFQDDELKKEWAPTNGAVYIKENKLLIHPLAGKNDAFVYLRGIDSSGNFRIETTAKADPESQFWIYTKFLDRNNYIRFGVASGRFYLQKTINGKMVKQVRGKKVEADYGFHTYELIMKQGQALVFLDGFRFGTINYLDMASSGEIAMEVWSKFKMSKGAELPYFKMRKFINQWVCLSANNAEDLEGYKDIFSTAYVLSPLCFESRNGKISGVSGINPMRMACGYYNMLLLPRIYLADFSEAQFDMLKSWVSSFLAEYAIDGLNIELSDELSQHPGLVNGLIENLTPMLEKRKLGLVITANIAPQFEEFYTKGVIAKCAYLIIRNAKLSPKLNDAIKQNHRLIRSSGFNKDFPNKEKYDENETVALW